LGFRLTGTACWPAPYTTPGRFPDLRVRRAAFLPFAWRGVASTTLVSTFAISSFFLTGRRTHRNAPVARSGRTQAGRNSMSLREQTAHRGFVMNRLDGAGDQPRDRKHLDPGLALSR